MNYSAVVVDDSHIQRVATTFLIKHHPQLELSGDFECPLEGIRFAMAEKADLLFLDVLYEDNNIFNVLEELKPGIDIIFNSSWAHFQKDTLQFATAGFLKNRCVAWILKSA